MAAWQSTQSRPSCTEPTRSAAVTWGTSGSTSAGHSRHSDEETAAAASVVRSRPKVHATIPVRTTVTIFLRFFELAGIRRRRVPPYITELECRQPDGGGLDP